MRVMCTANMLFPPLHFHQESLLQERLLGSGTACAIGENYHAANLCPPLGASKTYSLFQTVAAMRCVIFKAVLMIGSSCAPCAPLGT